MEGQQLINQRLKDAVSLTISAGYQLDGAAFTFLKTLVQTREVKEILEGTIERVTRLAESPLFITKEMLEETMKMPPLEKEESPSTVVEGVARAFRPPAEEIEAEIEVVDDPTDKISSKGNMEDFLKYFRDRFTRIEGILKQRLDVRDAVPISVALEAPLNSKVKTIGIVTEIRERKRMIFMQIEDYEATATVLVPPNVERTVFEKAQRIFLDQVICIQGMRGKNSLIVATDFINPDIPERKPKTAKSSVYAALISDLHVGSKKFLEDSFNHFLQWLKGQGGSHRQREVAGRVKYIIICGDLVDGIGVYPNQERELAIDDVYEQYRVVAKIIQNIPEHIEVIIIPGNHDATRQALPQPAIPKKYAEPVYEARKVMMLGNPARIRLHGVEFLLYHGRSLDDVIGVIPEVTYRNLDKSASAAMRYLLKVRHLAPIYGRKTPIAPEPKDFLVIDSPPDVFHSGHIHVMGYEMYRGTLVINSGAWQGQTEFQRKMGLEPTPGIVPIVDLRRFQVMPINFIA